MSGIQNITRLGSSILVKNSYHEELILSLEKCLSCSVTVHSNKEQE